MNKKNQLIAVISLAVVMAGLAVYWPLIPGSPLFYRTFYTILHTGVNYWRDGNNSIFFWPWVFDGMFLGIGIPILIFLFLGTINRGRYNRNKTAEHNVIQAYLKDACWRLNLLTLKQIGFRLLLVAVLLVSMQIAFIPYVALPQILMSALLWSFLGYCLLIEIRFLVGSRYSIPRTAQLIDDRLGMKQALITSYQTFGPNAGGLQAYLVANVADTLKINPVQKLFPRRRFYLPRNRLVKQVVMINLAALLISFSLPHAVSSYVGNTRFNIRMLPEAGAEENKISADLREIRNLTGMLERKKLNSVDVHRIDRDIKLLGQQLAQLDDIKKELEQVINQGRQIELIFGIGQNPVITPNPNEIQPPLNTANPEQESKSAKSEKTAPRPPIEELLQRYLTKNIADNTEPQQLVSRMGQQPPTFSPGKQPIVPETPVAPPLMDRGKTTTGFVGKELQKISAMIQKQQDELLEMIQEIETARNKVETHQDAVIGGTGASRNQAQVIAGDKEAEEESNGDEWKIRLAGHSAKPHHKKVINIDTERSEITPPETDEQRAGIISQALINGVSPANPATLVSTAKGRGTGEASLGAKRGLDSRGGQLPDGQRLSADKPGFNYQPAAPGNNVNGNGNNSDRRLNRYPKNLGAGLNRQSQTARENQGLWPEQLRDLERIKIPYTELSLRGSLIAEAISDARTEIASLPSVARNDINGIIEISKYLNHPDKIAASELASAGKLLRNDIYSENAASDQNRQKDLNKMQNAEQALNPDWQNDLQKQKYLDSRASKQPQKPGENNPPGNTLTDFLKDLKLDHSHPQVQANMQESINKLDPDLQKIMQQTLNQMQEYRQSSQNKAEQNNLRKEGNLKADKNLYKDMNLNDPDNPMPKQSNLRGNINEPNFRDAMNRTQEYREYSQQNENQDVTNDNNLKAQKNIRRQNAHPDTGQPKSEPTLDLIRQLDKKASEGGNSVQQLQNLWQNLEQFAETSTADTDLKRRGGEIMQKLAAKSQMQNTESDQYNQDVPKNRSLSQSNRDNADENLRAELKGYLKSAAEALSQQNHMEHNLRQENDKNSERQLSKNNPLKELAQRDQTNAGHGRGLSNTNEAQFLQNQTKNLKNSYRKLEQNKKQLTDLAQELTAPADKLNPSDQNLLKQAQEQELQILSKQLAQLAQEIKPAQDWSQKLQQSAQQLAQIRNEEKRLAKSHQQVQDYQTLTMQQQAEEREKIQRDMEDLKRKTLENIDKLSKEFSQNLEKEKAVALAWQSKEQLDSRRRRTGEISQKSSGKLTVPQPGRQSAQDDRQADNATDTDEQKAKNSKETLQAKSAKNLPSSNNGDQAKEKDQISTPYAGQENLADDEVFAQVVQRLKNLRQNLTDSPAPKSRANAPLPRTNPISTSSLDNKQVTQEQNLPERWKLTPAESGPLSTKNDRAKNEPPHPNQTVSFRDEKQTNLWGETPIDEKSGEFGNFTDTTPHTPYEKVNLTAHILPQDPSDRQIIPPRYQPIIRRLFLR
ncbi:MAG: hypothetical protein HZA78_10495 [Candidatus Schekmanbacteria bacterium]|nr:hypothetical protein [Candidatus Schekmanbacteria bacterium]